MVSAAWLKQEREAARQWARDVLAREFVIFDGETTGLEYDDEFVQVAAIDQTGAVLLDALVKPVKPIDPDATAVHGLVARDVAAAPGFAAVYPALMNVLQGRLIVAYNADFDRRILEQACQRYGLPAPVFEWQCAMRQYARYYGRWNPTHRSFKWQSLTAACAYERIPLAGQHSALGDCRLTLRLLQAMAAPVPDA